MNACAVPKCARPVVWELDNEEGRTWYVCGRHLDSWTTYLFNRDRTICTQRRHTPTRQASKPGPKPEPTLF